LSFLVVVHDLLYKVFDDEPLGLLLLLGERRPVVSENPSRIGSTWFRPSMRPATMRIAKKSSRVKRRHRQSRIRAGVQ
jgi:hypothetical protein